MYFIHFYSHFMESNKAKFAVDRTILPPELFGLHEQTTLNPNTEAATRDVASEIAPLLEDKMNARKFEAIANLPGYFFPKAKLEHLVVAEHFITWLFYVDDLIDTETRRVGDKRPELIKIFTDRLMEIFETGNISSIDFPGMDARLQKQIQLIIEYTPKVRAQFSTVMTDVRFKDIISKVHNYLRGCAAATQNASKEKLPPIKEFEDIRIDEGASLPCIEIIDILDEEELVQNGAEVKPARQLTEAERDIVDQMARLCALIMSHVNDVVSWARDYEEDADKINSIVRVFMEKGDQDPRTLRGDEYIPVDVYEGHFRVARRIFELKQEFSRLAAKLPEELRNKWAKGMVAMIDGNAAWSMASKRYRNKNHFITKLRPPEQVDELRMAS